MVFEQPTAASLAATVPPVADPAIQALLAQVSEMRIHDLIADLSGDRAALIGGKSVTISTRYTLPNENKNFEAYVHQHYAALGVTTRSPPVGAYSSYGGRDVTADIPGIVHPERIWLVGGHLDSTSTAPYSTTPGADDNASGTAATWPWPRSCTTCTLPTRSASSTSPARSRGCWAARSMLTTCRISGAQVMGYIDLDMIGWDGNLDRIVELHSGTGSPSVALANAFISANERYGQGLMLELKQSTATRFSDHSSFWDKGYASFLTLENFHDDAIFPQSRSLVSYHRRCADRVDLNYVTLSTHRAGDDG